MYLNHQQQLASNPYASRPQAHHVNGMAASPSIDDPTMINASVNGMPNAVQNTVANAHMGNVPPAAFAYNQLPQYGTPNRHDNPNMNWIGRYPSRPNQMNQLASNTSLLSSVPPAMGHVMNNSLTGSPAYGSTTGLTSSPHTGSMMSTRVSPVPPTTHQTNSLSTSSVNGATSSEWQQQIYCAEISRQSYSPHHHARAAALAARSSINANQDPKRAIQLPASAAANGLSFPLSNDPNRKPTADNNLGGIPASPAKLAGLRTPSSSSKNSNEDDKQSWTTIDMGGLSLKNIGPEVFRYTFLTSLFINHNQLTTLPQAIVQLRNLSILDASANKLVMIPAELGLLSELRAIFLFDNCLTVLPPELGSLYQLELLGIEGNPLQEDLMSIIQREGTQALIAFLRDSCPVSVPPPEREWIAIDAKIAPEKEDPNNTFLVLSYNVLCEKYATPQMYGYTPRWALMWDYRKEFILQEITSYGADICCLQEVEMGQYEDFFEPKMQQCDYEGLFWPKTRARTMRDDEKKHVDGCATFFNSRVYRLVDKQLIEFNQIALQRPDFKKTEDIFNRVMTKDNVAAIAMLEHRVTGAKLLVANAHMHWDPEFRDVKLVQSAMLMEQLEIIGDRFAKLAPQTTLDSDTKLPTYKNGKQIPMVICGDFNSTPDSGVYEFLSEGTAMPTHHDFMDYKYGTYTSEGLRHGYQLRSAYNSIGELPTTNWTPGFRGAIDYIWYSSNTLANSGLLGEVDPGYLSRVVGFPNAHFPSEYVWKY
ncbi:poly(A)-specific ribonuclease [Malassezia psittaci]|uniref:CCR4-Not complex 3'-5'-exoribonuclease subunit Ccr4 n=1 Tax=Malassezia psittaci TaxID=1821823 RepID=A0AAF0FDX1_9BASI|nr:poly(A)-specific ribonuclease [Malassezia psittaci]